MLVYKITAAPVEVDENQIDVACRMTLSRLGLAMKDSTDRIDESHASTDQSFSDRRSSSKCQINAGNEVANWYS